MELALWWSLFAGPVSWLFDLGFSYSLTQHSCSTGHYYVLHLISALCFVGALSGLYFGLANYRRFDAGSEEGGYPHDRAYFQALIGILFSISFAIVIIAGSVPRWVLSPCS